MNSVEFQRQTFFHVALDFELLFTINSLPVDQDQYDKGFETLWSEWLEQKGVLEERPAA